MQFAYTKRRLLINLILGIGWLGIGISYFFEKDESSTWKPYLVTVLGICYISFFLFEFFRKYFQITSEKIIINTLPKEEIELKYIKEVKYYANDYTFKTTNKTLKIVKSQINKKQLPDFEKFFKNFENKLAESSI